MNNRSRLRQKSAAKGLVPGGEKKPKLTGYLTGTKWKIVRKFAPETLVGTVKKSEGGQSDVQRKLSKC